MMPIPRRTKHWEEQIDRLDPVKDAGAIVDILVNHVFPLDVLLATELGQARTFTIPSIAKIFHATRQYEDEGMKRIDDTKAILTEIFTAGSGTPHAQAMVDHLNAIHAHYAISNEDYLYTMSVFVVDPWVWLEKYGWRPLRTHERDALLQVHRELGEAMGIRDIPQTFDELLAWRRRYEATAQRPHPANHAVAEGFFRAIGELLPPTLRRTLVPFSLALMDDPRIDDALGYPHPSSLWRRGVQRAMRVRQVVLRYVNPWERTRLGDVPFFNRYVTYPNGYDPLALGPTKLVARIAQRRASGCPVHVARKTGS